MGNIITNKYITDFLMSNIDEKYKIFSSNLIPDCNKMLGVRLPILRKFAKKIAKENNVKDILETMNCTYFEEVMLQGLIIGYYKCDIHIIIELCKKFVPKIDNWSICDSFCNSLKIAKKYPNEMLNYISSYIASKNTYELRFLIVMLLNHFVEDKYLNYIFYVINTVEDSEYYVQMAIAWLLSVCYIKYPQTTLNYLKDCNINKFTYNKTIQKITESFRVSDHDKEILKKLKK